MPRRVISPPATASAPSPSTSACATSAPLPSPSVNSPSAPRNWPTGPPGVRTAFALDNEITYLSLPPVPDAIAILGSGYAAVLLRHLPWLDDVDLRYWGDTDSHGIAILDQVRGRFPHTTSLLMDHATLLAHESHWGQEKTQARDILTHLTPEEAHLDQDLRTGTYRPQLAPGAGAHRHHRRARGSDAAPGVTPENRGRRKPRASPGRGHLPDGEVAQGLGGMSLVNAEGSSSGLHRGELPHFVGREGKQ